MGYPKEDTPDLQYNYVLKYRCNMPCRFHCRCVIFNQPTVEYLWISLRAFFLLQFI